MTDDRHELFATTLERLGQLMKPVPLDQRAIALPLFLHTALFLAEKDIAARAA